MAIMSSVLKGTKSCHFAFIEGVRSQRERESQKELFVPRSCTFKAKQVVYCALSVAQGSEEETAWFPVGISDQPVSSEVRRFKVSHLETDIYTTWLQSRGIHSRPLNIKAHLHELKGQSE